MSKNILEYLENSAKKYPQKRAFADQEMFCTYKELVASANIIGTRVAQATRVRKPVPVFMEKSVHAVMAFMGIVSAGCFYILLDPKQPVTRLNQIIATLEPDVIIADGAKISEVKKLDFTGEVLCFQEIITGEMDERLLRQIKNQMLDIDPLYANFTSGSTGTPKGVVVSHRSVIDFIDCFSKIFQITDEDIIGNQAPFDFDVSVKDIYTTLKVGATMEIIPRKLFSFPMELLDYLCERKVTTLIWAVSALCIITTLKGLQYKIPSNINKILFSGEVMPIKHLNEWRRYLPDVTYVNLYGPTEITCNCTYYKVDRTFEIGDVLPIGKAFPNEKVFLIDDEGKLIEKDMVGMLGEVCVSGTALALGYYNNPEQTKKAFVQNPLHNNYQEIIYKTGDLAFYNERSELCFASRKDFQIKHMGHRIELGEIEVAMDAVEELERVCCVYLEDKGKIIAFYQGEVTKKEIQKTIMNKLPSYMLPNKYIQIASMPITNNGKINRKQLISQYMEAN
ncbi:amino acid adenylation domain-containing protein [Lachnospiraceae bacterium LCP25S3_G4]